MEFIFYIRYALEVQRKNTKKLSGVTYNAGRAPRQVTLPVTSKLCTGVRLRKVTNYESKGLTC